MKRISIPVIVFFSLWIISSAAIAQTNEDTTKVVPGAKKTEVKKKIEVKPEHQQQDTTQTKITVNDDGVRVKRKMKKSAKNKQENKIEKKEETPLKEE